MSTLETFLKDRYLNLKHDDIDALIKSDDNGFAISIVEYTKNTLRNYTEGLNEECLLKNDQIYTWLDGTIKDYPVGTNFSKNLSAATPNHAIFAQATVEGLKRGNFEKSAQLLVSSLHTKSNPDDLSDRWVIDDLINTFKKSQGLVELPISTVLKIGALYDSYYYKEKDGPINFSTINGLSTKEGIDLLNSDDVLYKHYGTYGFSEKDLAIVTSPFIRPITPKSIDDKMLNGFENYSNTNITKNYRTSFYNFDNGRYESISNNISSHIPFSGYGVLNNYLNTMSKIFFKEGLDGGEVNASINDDKIPYHIIGNYNGRLKTIKTYNDQHINLMTSYNSYGVNVEFELEDIVEEFSALTSSITLDDDFIFTNKYSKEKIEFFLILSKIKVNYLNGTYTLPEVYNKMRDLCEINNLGAKENDEYELPDLVALLLYSMYPPDGPEPSEGLNRPNKKYKILSKYLVDENSFIGISTEEPSPNNQGLSLQKEIIKLEGNYVEIFRVVSKLLIEIWSKELVNDKTRKLNKLDKKGTFVLYPGAGGAIDLDTLFSKKRVDKRVNSKKSVKSGIRSLKKSNVVASTITENDLSTSGFISVEAKHYKLNGPSPWYDKTYINDILMYQNESFYTRYEEIVDAINRPSTELDKIKFFQRNPSEDDNDFSILDNTLDYLGKFEVEYFKPQSYPSNATTINYLDRYDDVHLIGNKIDIANSSFDNKLLVLNTPRLLWFEHPNNRPSIGGVEENRPSLGYVEENKFLKSDGVNFMRGLYDIKERVHNSFNMVGLESKEIEDLTNNTILHTGYYFNGSLKDFTFKDYPVGKGLYNSYQRIVNNPYDWSNPADIDTYSNDSVKAYDTYSAKSLIDIFDVDKLEDFRLLYKQFSGDDTSEYFTKTFNTFNFKSLVRHLNTVGYSDISENLTLNGRSFSRDEISALLCGYTGHFIEFGSRNGLSRLINTSLTIAQESKAKFVIDEFMNDKITVNNYSTAGPLSISNTENNPNGIRINTFPFNPIIAYSYATDDDKSKTYEGISEVTGDPLLFRTILFGDQKIRPYNPSALDGLDDLIDKYVYFADTSNLGYYDVSINPKIGNKIVITELTKNFFKNLNIELNLGNLQLLISYLRAYINYTLKFSPTELNRLFPKINTGWDSTDRAASIADKLGDKFKLEGLGDYLYVGGNVNSPQKSIFTNGNIKTAEIIDGEFTVLEYEAEYMVNDLEDLNMVEKFNEWVKDFNKRTVDRTIEVIDKSVERLRDVSSNYDSGSADIGNAKNEISSEVDSEVKSSTYYRIKTLYDKNVSFKNIDLTRTTLLTEDLANVDPNDVLNTPLFYNFNVQNSDFCDEDSSGSYKEDRVGKDNVLKDLYSYSSILDRGNNDYGSKVLVDLIALSASLGKDINSNQDVKKATDRTMWSVLSQLASEHEFLLLPLTSYINLSSSTRNEQSPYELAHDMFGVFKELTMWDSNPAFVFQLGSLTSDISGKGKKKKGFNQAFDPSNTFCLDLDPNELDVDGKARLLNEDTPADIKNSEITSFIVDFANTNQSMFKNIQISTEEFTNTEESIKTVVSLSDKNSGVVLSSGKLFSAMESRSYSCTVTSLGNATIQPLSYFYLRNVPLFYGTYWITNVSHKITANNMITTFKGVRQPVAKKPTANKVVLNKLISSAIKRSQQTGFTDRNDRTPIQSSGIIYSDRGI